jgi:hypothetical protein
MILATGRPRNVTTKACPWRTRLSTAEKARRAWAAEMFFSMCRLSPYFASLAAVGQSDFALAAVGAEG